MAQVSVIIPVYNIEAHLRQCLDSVAGQTLKDIEIICVDDGSTDASPLILAEYAVKDSRFQVVTQANAGPGLARNAGLALASGEFVIFLDSDDWFEPDFLEKMVRRAQETEADVTICRAVEFDNATGKELPSEWMLKTQYIPAQNAFTPQEIAEHLFQFTYGWPWDKLYRHKFLAENQLTYPAISHSEDLVLVFQSLALAQELAAIDEVFIHHRVNRMESVSNEVRTNKPDDAYRAVLLLRDALQTRGLYQVYERSFLNWAMEFLVWNVSNMGDIKVQKYYFQRLKYEWLSQLEFNARKGCYYYNQFTYAKYVLIRHVPFHVFHVLLTAYKIGKQRWNEIG